MDMLDKNSGVWFFYDGECPLCSYAAHIVKLKNDFGEIHIINARDLLNEALVKQVSQLGYDLDKGMLIYTDGRYYHAEEALMFVSRYGKADNFFMALCNNFFRLKYSSLIIYPFMRLARNVILRFKGKEKINNLNISEER